MTRKKVNLAFIANDSERKASFRKRKKSVLKKVSELSTLCGVDACAVIFSPYDGEPVVWPSHLGVQSVLEMFRRMPESEQNKKMVNQEAFTRQRIRKAEEQLRKQQKENRRKEIGHIITQCLAGVSYQTFNVRDLNDMRWVLNQNLMEINMRIESLKEEHLPQEKMTNGMHIGESSNQGNIAPEIPTNEAQNFPWNMEMPRPDEPQAFGWEDTLLPYASNDGAPGPSFAYRQLGN